MAPGRSRGRPAVSRLPRKGGLMSALRLWRGGRGCAMGYAVAGCCVHPRRSVGLDVGWVMHNAWEAQWMMEGMLSTGGCVAWRGAAIVNGERRKGRGGACGAWLRLWERGKKGYGLG